MHWLLSILDSSYLRVSFFFFLKIILFVDDIPVTFQNRVPENLYRIYRAKSSWCSRILLGKKKCAVKLFRRKPLLSVPRSVAYTVLTLTFLTVCHFLFIGVIKTKARYCQERNWTNRIQRTTGDTNWRARGEVTNDRERRKHGLIHYYNAYQGLSCISFWNSMVSYLLIPLAFLLLADSCI